MKAVNIGIIDIVDGLPTERRDALASCLRPIVHGCQKTT